MARPAILETFKSHEFLRNLDDRCLMDLASGARPFSIPAGGYLARRGQAATGFYLIQSGTVVVGRECENGELTPVLTIGPGGVAGWSWLVPPHTWKFTCRAVDSPVTGLMFDAAWLRDRCENNHELGYHLLRELIASLTSRLVESHEQLDLIEEPVLPG